MVGKIEGVLWLSRRVAFVVAVVGHYRHHASVAGLATRCCKIEGNGQVSSPVFFYKLPVQVKLLLPHDGLKMKCHLFFACKLRDDKTLAVPGNALVISSATGFGRYQRYRMGQRYHFPPAIVELCCLCSGHIAQLKPPSGIKVVNLAAAVGQRKKTGYRYRSGQQGMQATKQEKSKY